MDEGEDAIGDLPAAVDPPSASTDQHVAGVDEDDQMNTSAIDPTELAIAEPDVPKRFGYQPALDGVRAISVIAVLAYHAGFGWMRGGFLGVEVFFVVSGFLITSLLIEERAANGRISLRQFWVRRARRLLPALVCVVVVVAAWAALFGTAEQHWQLRRDLPWALGYAANWGQILGEVPYFAAADPPLLRHLWSLAVEEQWYLVWPLAFLVIGRLPRRLAAATLMIVAGGVVGWMVWLSSHDGPIELLDADRTNFLYLSTVTRSPGLLIGAAAALVWQPWTGTRRRRVERAVRGGGAVGLFVLVAAFGVARITAVDLYRWGLPAVSLASLAVVAAAVTPGRSALTRTLGAGPLVAVGRRSYGLYLWSWPVGVICDATTGSVPRVALALGITAMASELCFRYVEMPIRRDGLSRLVGVARLRPAWATVGGVLTAGSIAALAAVFVVAPPFNPAADLSTPVLAAEAIELSVGEGEPTATAASEASRDASSGNRADGSASPRSTSPNRPVSPTSSGPPVTQPRLPRRIVVVGDSQAESFALNMPSGIDDWFVFDDGSINGCSVYDDGEVVTTRQGFGRSFDDCQEAGVKWARSVAQADADLALVMLGAWDVFDLRLDTGKVIAFGSKAGDAHFLDALGNGIDALLFSGAEVALLEVPCMRPIEARGAAVPPLPERADDARIRHLNGLLRKLADDDPERVTFIEGPDEWCNGDPIATDTAYRWDGVHDSRRGAKLTFDTIADDLLEIPL